MNGASDSVGKDFGLVAEQRVKTLVASEDSRFFRTDVQSLKKMCCIQAKSANCLVDEKAIHS